MRLNRESALFSLFITAFIVATGTFWAFQRGGQDFSVFYSAWQLILEGRAMEIYSEATPDRFLYAPGFAWLLSPLGLLPKIVALALWTFLKAAVIGFVIREFGTRISVTDFLMRDRLILIGFASWGVLLFSRPLLIEFQYGQINIFILGACVWALLGRFRTEPVRPFRVGLRWFTLGVLAITKLFPGPLLLVPFLAVRGFASKQLRAERIGACLGVALVLLLPTVSVGIGGALDLLILWKGMLLDKGMPLETHNQSFSAFLMHFFSGEATPVIAQGGARVNFGAALLSPEVIKVLSITWTVSLIGFTLFWMQRVARVAPLKWCAVLTGLIILPSHLVWKPYFVMAIPVAILAAHRLVSCKGKFRTPLAWAVLMVLFAAVNFSGFDFVGHRLGAYFEAAAVLFWAHVSCMVLVLWPDRSRVAKIAV